MNISNGALIVKHDDRLYVCDLENYQGTYILGEDGGVEGKIDGLMWFAAPYGNNIYFSNQRNYDHLYCLDAQNLSVNCILKHPCSYLTIFADKLYFLDETDSLLYEMDLKSNRINPLIKDKISSFILCKGACYCACAKGLLVFDLRSGKSTWPMEHIPLCLDHTPGGLIFSDTSRGFVLSSLKTGQREPEVVGCVKTQSLVTAEEYIYAANLSDNRSIVRLTLGGGEAIRFCG
jgi:hypothetical protein